MDLITLKRKFINLGYYCPVFDDTLVIGTDPVYDKDFPQIGTYKAFCSLKIQGDIIVVGDAQSQIPVEDEFKTEAEAIAFITSRFPV